MGIRDSTVETMNTDIWTLQVFPFKAIELIFAGIDLKILTEGQI